MAISILAWICIPLVLFFIGQTLVQLAFSDDIAFEAWIGETYFIVWQSAPLFLYLTGTMISDKKLRITANIFLVLYGVYYILNLGNTYEYVDIPHLQYPASIALTGLTVTWLIHLRRNGSFKFGGATSKLFNTVLGLYILSVLILFAMGYKLFNIPNMHWLMYATLIGWLIIWAVHLVKTKKGVLDVLKFIWLFGLAYSFIIPRFVPQKHESGNYYLASLFVFPVMMTIGLYKFFANKNQTHE